MVKLSSPFSPFDNMLFTDNQCFLCGSIILDGATQEHVFPKWLLRKFNLWDERLNLINSTSIPYRYLTIPCCRECNSIFLSIMESTIEEAVSLGPEEVEKVSEITTYLWMGKIFYGLLYKDLSLLADQKDPTAGHLNDPEYIKNYRALHGFLQSSRANIEFSNFFPGSIFIFNIEQTPNFFPFDYSDNPIGMTICIRMDNIGIIACLKDDGLIKKNWEHVYNATKGKKLYPVQFDEFCAIIFYEAYFMVRSGKYLSICPNSGSSSIYKMPGFSFKPYFDDWNPEIFTRFLAEFLGKYGYKHEDIFKPPYQLTFLKDFM